MASMYDVLKDYLLTVKEDSITLTYSEINTLIKKRNPYKKLPQTAYKNTAWWDNNSDRHTQMYSWVNAGFLVDMRKSNLGDFIYFRKTLQDVKL